MPRGPRAVLILNLPCCPALPAALSALPHGAAGQCSPRVSPLLSLDSRHVPRASLLQPSLSWHCSLALSRGVCRRASDSMCLAWVHCPAARTAAVLVKDENWGGRGAWARFPKKWLENLSGKPRRIKWQCLRWSRPGLAVTTGMLAPRHSRCLVTENGCPGTAALRGDALAAPNELSLMSSAPAVVMGMELMQCLSVTIHFSANRGTSIPFAL